MKNKIVEILEGSIDTWGERNANDIAEEILNLINLEKAKENCYQEEKMRDKGWLHKDDPVKALRVERECPECQEGQKIIGETPQKYLTRDMALDGGIDEGYIGSLVGEPELIWDWCENCAGTGKISSSLTVGEALEMVEGLLHTAKQVCKVGCIHRATPTDEPLWACKSCWVGKNLSTKDGGRIVREEEDEF